MDRTKEIFAAYGLKATAQRMIVYKALENLGHASVDQITSIVHATLPSVSVATIYKVLEALMASGLISALFTHQGKIYYDVTPSVHHHLYSEPNSGFRIEDYHDPELTSIIMKYLSEKNIDGFMPNNIRLQIIGDFDLQRSEV